MYMTIETTRDIEASKYASQFDSEFRDHADQDFTAGWDACLAHIKTFGYAVSDNPAQPDTTVHQMD